MKIQQIQFNRYIKPLGFKAKLFSSPIKQQNNDVFIKTNSNERLYDEFCERSGMVTKEEYKEVISANSDILKLAKSDCVEAIDLSPSTVAKTAYNLKKYLDEKYGEQKYKIISIGTSPAIIAEGMRFLGTDVAFIPLSNVANLPLEDSIFTLYQRLEGELDEHVEVFNELIERETLDDDKIYILLDYVCTGRSMKRLYKLIDDIQSLDKKNIASIYLPQFLEKHQDEFKYDYYRGEIGMLNHHFARSTIERVSNIPHFDIARNHMNKKEGHIKFNGDINEFISNMKNFSKPLARAYSLLVFNELEKL